MEKASAFPTAKNVELLGLYPIQNLYVVQGAPVRGFSCVLDKMAVEKISLLLLLIFM